MHPRARRPTLSHHSVVAASCIFQSRHCDIHPGARSTLSWTLRNRRRRRLTISGNRHSDLRLRFRHRSDEQARTLLLGPFFARLAVPSVSVLSSNGVSCTAMSIRNVHHYVYTRAALRRRHVEHFPATHFIFARHCLLCDELDTDAPNSGDDGFRRPTLRLPVLPTRSPATTRHRPLPSPRAPVVTTQSRSPATTQHRPLPSPRAPVVTTVTTVTSDDPASTAAIAASPGLHHSEFRDQHELYSISPPTHFSLAYKSPR